MNKGSQEQRINTASQLGALLRKRRRARALSQAELAAKLGLSQARFSAIENEMSGLTLERLLSLANLLDLELVIRDRAHKKPSTAW